jgi:hypothetical protein
MSNSIKGKADLWRFGKDGASPGKREKIPGGGEDFQATASFRNQYKGHPKTGGGGAHAPSSTDNQGVFANSIAGLEIDAKAFLPNPGKGRAGLDMYSAGKSDEFGLDLAKEPDGRKKPL